MTDALVGELHHDGALVLQVEGLVEEPYPYAPVRRMLEPLLSYADTLEADSRRIARETINEAMGEYASVLQPILPELAGGDARPDDLPKTADSEQVYRGLASMLSSLAEQAGGGLIVVDDAHQLDDATRNVLERVAIDSEQTPLMLVAVCDDQAPPERIDPLADSLSEMLETRLELGPVPPDALEELIRRQLADRPVDTRLLERITTLSNGNPYAAAAYVRAILDAAVLRPTWNGWEVDEAALETLERLDDRQLRSRGISHMERALEIAERHRSMGVPPDDLQYYQGYFFVYLCYLRLHQIEHKVVDREAGLEKFDRALEALEAVADTGIGMTEAEQAEIFEPFFQTDDSSTSEYRGTGLGLTLVQRFAEQMGGRIEVDSAPGEGTTFRLELPADPDFAATDDEEAAAETSTV